MMFYDMKTMKKNEAMRIRKVGKEYYLFGNGVCFELNELGALTWNYLGGDLSTDVFCMKVSQKYKEEDVDKIKRDVNEFLSFLTEQKVASVDG